MNKNATQQLLVGFFDNTHSYAYPDADICLFREFPHERQVFAYIQSASMEYACTCTLMWLLKNWRAYDLFSLNNTSVGKCLRADFFDAKLKDCRFEWTLEQCDAVIEPDKVKEVEPIEWAIAAPFIVILVFLVAILAAKVLLTKKVNKVEGDARPTTSQSGLQPVPTPALEVNENNTRLAANGHVVPVISIGGSSASPTHITSETSLSRGSLPSPELTYNRSRPQIERRKTTIWKP